LIFHWRFLPNIDDNNLIIKLVHALHEARPRQSLRGEVRALLTLAC
jgi:hypothetical protein